MKTTHYKIEVGSGSFEKFVTHDFLLVDKTLLINDIIEGGNEVLLITRPRRWGKTLNMSMLNYFFSIPTNEDGVADKEKQREKITLFSNMKISSFPEIIKQYCGQYPTIFVSFKDIKADNYEAIKRKIGRLIQDLYIAHMYLKNSDNVTNEEKTIFQRYLMGTEDELDLEQSLKFLSSLMYKHFNRKVIILIDEYDTTMNDWYAKAFSDDEVDRSVKQLLQKILDLFRNMFGAALKDNDYLKRGVITGILRIAKASLFSGLNNLGADCVLDHRYAQHFGFTENEVNELLHEMSLDHDKIEIQTLKEWYNGYNIGGVTIYNPWSIMNYLLTKGELKAYWVGTASTTLIENALVLDRFQEDVQKLIEGEGITAIADPQMVFTDIKSSSNALYNLLLFSGYLTAERVEKGKAGMYDCLVRVPNKEILEVFEVSIIQWLSRKFNIGPLEYDAFVNTLLAGKVDLFLSKLKAYLAESASFYSTNNKNAEIFYNGFMVGLIASVSQRYYVETEKESGQGRIDVVLIPKLNARYKNALILEFKVTDQADNLQMAAQRALAQINTKKYEAKIKAYEGVEHIFKIGLAFCGKEVEMVWEG